MPRWDIWVLLLVAVREVLGPPVASLGAVLQGRWLMPRLDLWVLFWDVLGAVLENQSWQQKEGIINHFGGCKIWDTRQRHCWLSWFWWWSERFGDGSANIHEITWTNKSYKADILLFVADNPRKQQNAKSQNVCLNFGHDLWQCPTMHRFSMLECDLKILSFFAWDCFGFSATGKSITSSILPICVYFCNSVSLFAFAIFLHINFQGQRSHFQSKCISVSHRGI